MGAILFVRSRSGRDASELDRRLLQRKPRFLEVPGLLQKVYGKRKVQAPCAASTSLRARRHWPPFAKVNLPGPFPPPMRWSSSKQKATSCCTRCARRAARLRARPMRPLPGLRRCSGSSLRRGHLASPRFPWAAFLPVLLLSCSPAPVTNGPADLDAPYEVGVVTGFVVDPSRPWDPTAAAVGSPSTLGFTDAEFDAATNVRKAVRTLVIEIWYPVEADEVSESDERATWGDFAFGSREVLNDLYSWLGPEAQDVIFDLQRGSFVGKPVAARGSPFPLILFLHGNGGGRYSGSAIAEALAKRGYVVIAPARIGNSAHERVGLVPGGVHPDLPVDAQGRYPNTLGRVMAASRIPGALASLRTQTEDIEAILEALSSSALVPSELSSLLAGRIDIDNVGLHGCSFGSSHAQIAQSVIPNVKAWSNDCSEVFSDPSPLVGTAIPASMVGTTPGLPCPPADQACIGTLPGRAFDNVPYVLVKPALFMGGREDRAEFDLAAELASLGLNPPPDPDGERFPIHRNLFEGAVGPVVYTLLDRLDHSGYGEGRFWIEMRERGFIGRTSTGLDGHPFVLQDAATLIEIRDHFLVNFYDAYLKGRVDRLSALTKNDFEEVGLRLEFRNIHPDAGTSGAPAGDEGRE